MNELLFFLGIIFVFWGMLEALWTTIWVDGNAAPMTGFLTTATWKSLKMVIPRSNNRLLSLSGPLILFLTICSWIFLIWLGWTLSFYSQPESLYVRGQELELQFLDYAWYVAYLMFTVGNGDFLPQEGLWQGLSMLISFSGMSMVTLAITYLFQVVQAVTNKRAFSSGVTSMGKTAEEVLLHWWNGNDFGSLELRLNTLCGELSRLNEQHLAFPILHYYHAARAEKSLDVAVVVLSEVLNLLRYGLKMDVAPVGGLVVPAKRTLESFLLTIDKAFIPSAKENPPDPDLGILRTSRLPIVSDEAFTKALEQEQQNRRLLYGLIKEGAWSWPGR